MFAVPMLLAQCQPSCTPPTGPGTTTTSTMPGGPDPEGLMNLHGCLDGTDVYWWTNQWYSHHGDDGLDGDSIIATVDGDEFTDDVRLGRDSEGFPSEWRDGKIETRGGDDVDLTLVGKDGVPYLRADNLGACPVVSLDIEATIDCGGELAVTVTINVAGGQFDPAPPAWVDLSVINQYPSAPDKRRVIEFLSKSGTGADIIQSGTVRQFSASGLDTSENWYVAWYAWPWAVNGEQGTPDFPSWWRPQTSGLPPVINTCAPPPTTTPDLPPSAGYILPFDCGQTGWRGDNEVHSGNQLHAIDFWMPGDDDVGLPVRASADGVVRFPAYSGSSTDPVGIDHEGDNSLTTGRATVYLHMTDPVANGTPVKRGDIIGYVGAVGANAYHLHYEQRQEWNVIPSVFTHWTPPYNAAMKSSSGVTIPPRPC